MGKNHYHVRYTQGLPAHLFCSIIFRITDIAVLLDDMPIRKLHSSYAFCDYRNTPSETSTKRALLTTLLPTLDVNPVRTYTSKTCLTKLLPTFYRTAISSPRFLQAVHVTALAMMEGSCNASTLIVGKNTNNIMDKSILHMPRALD